MLGLIYKDIAAHKYLLLFQAGFVAMVTFTILSAKEQPAAAVFMLVMLYIGFSAIPETAMQTDVAERWNVFALTLPTAVRKTVLAKFLLMAFMYAGAFLCSVIIMAVFVQVSGTDFSVLPLVTLFAFIVGFDSITYALVFRFGHKRGLAFKALSIFAVPMLGVLYLLFGDLTIFGEDGITDFLMWIIDSDFSFADLVSKICLPVVIFGIVSFAVCYSLSCKGYLKGIEAGD